MNKKGKNKKGKIPHPTTAQSETPGEKDENIVLGDKESAVKASETMEKVEENLETVKEARVPEIVSEILPLAITTKDEETPKKPKRNRGKKKKGKDDDVDNNVEEDSRVTDTSLNVQEKSSDIVEVDKEAIENLPITITPTAPKKKNKKKNAGHIIEESVIMEPEQILLLAKESPAQELKELDTNKTADVKDRKQESNKQNEGQEQDVKLSKKKNKKKNRNESEKTDKEDISCVSTPSMKEEQFETKGNEKAATDTVSSQISVESKKEIQGQKEMFQEARQSQEIVELKESLINTCVNIADSLPQLSTPENKTKKKNKKDKYKRETTKLEACDECLFQPDTILNVQENIKQDVVEQERNENVMAVENPALCIDELISKHKAIIAKPVQKKHKEKQDVEVDIVQNDSYALGLPEQLCLVKSEDSELKQTNKEIVSEIKSDDIQNKPLDCSNAVENIGEQSKDLQVFELLNIPDKTVGKKRKKGTKVPKTPDVSFELPEPSFESKLPGYDLINFNQESTVTSVTSNASGENKLLVALDSKSTESTRETGKQEHILLTPEILEENEQINIANEIVDMTKDHNSETNSSKKRKKSPKLPLSLDTKSVTNTPIIQTPTVMEESPKGLDITNQEKEKNDTSEMAKLYDIEITSIKTDEIEGATCDVIPDITYPRSSSQQLSDDNNNNTIIREIFPVQQIVSDHVMQDCVKSSDITVKEKTEISQVKEEKTDLKSKMMEVNQDMEELRLSIERSLAGLSFIEKHDQLNEKQFEESKIKGKDDVSKVKGDVDFNKMSDEYEKNIVITDEGKSSFELSKQLQDVIITGENSNNKNSELSPIVDNKQSLSCIIQGDKISEECKASELKFDMAIESFKTSTFVTDTSLPPVTPMTIEEKLTETLLKFDTRVGNKSVIEVHSKTDHPIVMPTGSSTSEVVASQQELKNLNTETNLKELEVEGKSASVCPTRKDQKNKHKKKKGKQDTQLNTSSATQNVQSSTSTQSSISIGSDTTKKDDSSNKKGNKSDSEKSKEKGKQQASNIESVNEEDLLIDNTFDPIEKFEDALTSSVDDVNQTFEMIVKESQQQSNPKINIIAPDDEKSPITPPKNLLGHPDIPVRSNKRDYKKEKDKIPNEVTAKVKIKDSVEVERKQSKNTQTVNKLRDCKMSENEDFVYKYNFRKVFLQNICHKCNKDLVGNRLACCYCNLVFYCGIKHKDEDWAQHQALCFAISTIGHLKNQKHIYADIKNITGHDYRLIRMQMIVSCEKILKRRLVPWEQEALLYPRICAHVACREWRPIKLTDCQGCGQISFCIEHADHYPKSHSRWCKSYSLYQKLVSYQQTKGKLDLKLPTKVMREKYEIPDKINEVLAVMYEEKISMNDIQYAALTQLATAPLTAAYCHQLYCKVNSTATSYKNPSFTIHVVGAELQFEADALNKWEVFFLHLRPDLQELRVVLVNSNLNPSNLPLDLLGKIKLCENCRQKKRRVIFSFQEKTYVDYKLSEDFVLPDIVCAFNPSIQRSSVYNGKDPWPSTVNIIIKQKIPFIITAYTLTELHKDCVRIKECAEPEYKFICEPKLNNFASVRPDRNFISDDEMPLMFKNYCFAVICG